MSSRIIRASAQARNQVSRFTFNPVSVSELVVPPYLRNVMAVETPWASVPTEAPAPPAPAPTELQTADLLRETRMKALEIEKTAYEKGFAEGQKASSEVAEKIADSLLRQYSASLEELKKLRREVFSTSEREVIHLALEIARKIVTREVVVDEDLILTLVKVAMARIVSQALVTIRVNPLDYQVIERHRGAQTDSGPLNETVKLVEDPLIGRGGCVIETESGTIDARVEEQFREIERVFFE